jgi:hypothetical protein
MTSAPFTRPITGTLGPDPSRASDSGANPITESITGGITASRRGPLHGDPSLSDGPREGQRLTIRVAVDLTTYQRIAEMSRGTGRTLEGAAADLLGIAASRPQLQSHRLPLHVETRVAPRPNGGRDSGEVGGTRPSPPRNLTRTPTHHPGPTSPCTEASPVRPTEEGERRD